VSDLSLAWWFPAVESSSIGIDKLKHIGQCSFCQENTTRDGFMARRDGETLSCCLNGPNARGEWRSTIVLRLLREATGVARSNRF
jgi:hypothetical protein